MAFRLVPREEKFFDLLESMSSLVHKGAGLLNALFENPRTLDEVYLASKAIHDVEHEADDLVHNLLSRLNKTFITPIDREDIYALTVRMDDVLDYVDAVAKRMVTFRVAVPTSHGIELSRIILRACEEMTGGVHLLRDMRRIEDIQRVCARINQYENEADQVMRDALHDLFNGTTADAIEIIKWKDLYEHLEIATDKCEDVANIIETVLVKNA